MIGKVLMAAVIGGAAVWIWRDEIQGYVDRMEKNGGGFRDRVADTLQAVQDTAENVFDKTKERVASGLESGREAIRPSADPFRP